MILFSLILILMYLPTNWSEAHAESDSTSSTYTLMVRCVGVRMKETVMITKVEGKEINETIREYIADCRILKSYKGDRTSGNVELVIGYDRDENRAGNIQPPYQSLTMHNSQCGYDIRINQIYVMFLSSTQTGVDLRSGPFSLVWVKPENKVSYGQLGWKWSEDKDAKVLYDKIGN